VLFVRLDERIDDALVQEAQEVRRLASGNDPETGEPFGTDVARIFAVFLERNIPARNEVLLTFVGGDPYQRSAQVVPYRLDRDPELVARWGSIRETDRGSVNSPAGPVEYLAVPLLAGAEAPGVFVTAIFSDRERADHDDAVVAVGGVGLAVLLIGSLLAWRLADRILGPVGAVTRTARSITEGDLAQRISAPGRDEIAELAATFNAMLDRLEAAFATQKQFLEDAGHELRTPITILRGHFEFLDDDPEQRRATVALLLDELGRMQRIVDDLSLLARAERPDFLRLDLVDVSTLTDELLSKAEALAPREWRLESRGRGRIVADRQRLTQAVIQLCTNAAEHTDEAGRISIGSAIVAGEARFCVRDSGPGVPADQQERIFERFARARERRGGEGAGLGLAIVRAIAVSHGGRVELESRPGEGSTFTLAVPAAGPRPRPEEER
jgi:signal transduction histidine kinase